MTRTSRSGSTRCRPLMGENFTIHATGTRPGRQKRQSSTARLRYGHQAGVSRQMMRRLPSIRHHKFDVSIMATHAGGAPKQPEEKEMKARNSRLSSTRCTLTVLASYYDSPGSIKHADGGGNDGPFKLQLRRFPFRAGRNTRKHRVFCARARVCNHAAVFTDRKTIEQALGTVAGGCGGLEPHDQEARRS